MTIIEQDAQCMPIITKIYAIEVSATLPESITCLRIIKYSYAATIEIPLTVEVIRAMVRVTGVNEALKLYSVEKKSVILSSNESEVKENA